MLHHSVEQESFDRLHTSSCETCSEEEDSVVSDLPLQRRKPLDKLGKHEEGSSTSSCDDSDLCEDVCFDPRKLGSHLDIDNGQKTVKRTMPIGGSRMAVAQFGASTGTAVWRVRIDQCGIQKDLRETKSAQVEAACRMVRDNSHGVKIGVAQKGANLKWFAGFDKHSIGLDCRGAVWAAGKQKKTQVIDKDRQRDVCFGEGDVVAVEVDFEAMVVRFGVNDIPLPGAYYLTGMPRNQEVYLAVSLLWPGEQVTFLSEELYE